jgi:hypothetical protein
MLKGLPLTQVGSSACIPYQDTGQAGACALCHTTSLTAHYNGVVLCQRCYAPKQGLDNLPLPESTPDLTTQHGLGMRCGLRQNYLTGKAFRAAVSKAAFENGVKAVRRTIRRSGAKCCVMSCVSPDCPFVVRATLIHGLWELSAAKTQVWDHSPGCAGDAYRWPSLADLASDVGVVGIIRATRTSLGFDQAMRRGDIARSVENLGYSFPAQGNQTEATVKNRRNRLLRRLRDKVLGFDIAGIQRNLAALIPWAKIFNEGSASATAETASPSHAHIETDDDGCFQSVTVVYARACELLRQHGLRVFSMDASHFVYLRGDLRLLVLAGFYAENTIAIVAVCVCFGETTANYAVMLHQVRLMTRFWSFFDDEKTCLFIDRGSAINSAVVNPDILKNGNAMYRHCYIHIVRNCEHKKIWGKCPIQLIAILANSETATDEKLALKNLERAHHAVYSYIVNNMDRSRFITRYSAHMDLKKTTSNGVEVMNNVAKTIGARESMPLQSIHMLTELVHKQVNEFGNKIAVRMRNGQHLTEFCQTMFDDSNRWSASLVIKNPQENHPYGVHAVSEGVLAEAIGTATFQTCVAPGHVSCSCASRRFKRCGVPCEHMVCVAKHRFPNLEDIGFTVQGTHLPCAYMLQDFDNWVNRSGLFFPNYVYNGDDMRHLTPQCGTSNAEFVPNISECLLRVDASMSMHLPALSEKNKPTKETKRFRSQGEVSTGRSIAVPRPTQPIDLHAEAARQQLLADSALVGKHFMIVYDSPNSKATFNDKARTPVKAQPRPITVLQRPHIGPKHSNRHVLKVQCALTNPQTDSRNAVRYMIVGKVSACYEVAKITKDMRSNQWARPSAKRVRITKTIHDA